MHDFSTSKLIPPFFSGPFTYIEALSKCLEEYLEFVNNHTKTDNFIIGKIKDLNENILSAILDIKKANTFNAYNRINKFIHNEFRNLDLPTYKLSSIKPLIRLRYSNEDLKYRKDIFHIPFSQRYKVSQQRYSIPGVPCLYLSGSAFTAWLELNKPNFSNLWCAGYRIRDLNVLDCAIRLDSFFNEENNGGKLLFYPFVIATSFATKYPDKPFKEEYIISNILLQAILDLKKFDGIRYFSTKISNYNADYGWMASNIVLPALSHESEYDINLSKSTQLTLPQPCSALIHSPNKGGVCCEGIKMTETDDRNNNLEQGVSHFEPKIFEWYTATQFFNIDGYLRDASYQKIED